MPKSFDAKQSFNVTSTSPLQRDAFGRKITVQILDNNDSRRVRDQKNMADVEKSHIPSGYYPSNIWLSIVIKQNYD